MRTNDIFHFMYNPSDVQGWDGRTHCFEGLLICREKENGEKYLQDTYWGFYNDNNRILSPEEAEKQGILTFYCNFDEIELINSYDQKYYDDSDLFMLHRQHACVESCKKWYKRKGAERSKTKMLQVLNNRINDHNYQIKSLLSDIERDVEKRTKVESGDLKVWI